MALKVSVDGVSGGNFAQLDEIAVRLERIGKAVGHNSTRVMRDEAKKIQEIARMMAPVEDGNLEKSIKVREKKGANNRITFMVWADGSTYAPKIGKNGETPAYVGDYLAFIHESVYNLGPLSRAKQSTVPYRVGRKFLERAFIERQGKIAERLNDAVKRSFGGRYSNFDRYMGIDDEGDE